MQQVLFRIPIVTEYSPDGIPIYGFGMMLFLAFLLCTWLAGRRAEREGIPKETIQDLAIWVFLGGLIGARLVYLVGEQHLSDPVEILVQLPKIWDGGIVLYGSIVGGTLAYFLAYFLVYRKQELDNLRLMDAVAPAIAVGLALGRFGCFLNGCCFGAVACASCLVTPVGFPLAAPAREGLVRAGVQAVAGFSVHDDIPRGADFRVVMVSHVDEMSAAYEAGLRAGSILKEVNGQKVSMSETVEGMINRVPRGSSALTLTFIPPGGGEETITFRPATIGLYPTQLYETVSMALLLLVLLAYEPLRRAPGQVMALLMVGYGIHRYLNEILRDDPRPKDFEWVGSVVLVLGGAVMWAWLQLRSKEAAVTAYVGPSDGATATSAPSPTQSPPSQSVRP